MSMWAKTHRYHSQELPHNKMSQLVVWELRQTVVLAKVTSVIHPIKQWKMHNINSKSGIRKICQHLWVKPHRGLSQSCHSPAPMTFSLVTWLGWISVANFRTAVLGSSYVCGSTYVFRGFSCSVRRRKDIVVCKQINKMIWIMWNKQVWKVFLSTWAGKVGVLWTLPGMRVSSPE